jgi:site-specific DNA-methyltransferase (adenine-specific)
MPSLFLGDCVEGLRRVDPACIDLTVTSPPFGALRKYGGHPFTSEVFEAVAAELLRVTRPGGVVCWVEGDEVLKDRRHPEGGGYSGLAWRHAHRFQDLGFAIWDVIITGVVGMRYPIPYRYWRPPVYCFVLSRGEPRTLNLLRDRKNKTAGQVFRHNERLQDGSLYIRPTKYVVQPYGVRTTVWLYPGGGGSPVGQRHPAPMHRSLAHDLIFSYSRKNDLVSDPFAGSCTTGEQAVLMGRDFVGF